MSRSDALRQLCERHHLAIPLNGPHRTTAEEDIVAYFCTRDPEPIGRFVAVTQHEDITYLYPMFDTLAAAQRKAAQHIADDLFPELPIAVVDLDTGAEYAPEIRASWRQIGA